MDTFTHEELEQIAKAAAEMHGQDWAKLPHYSKDIWRETVRHPLSGPPQNDMERCVVKAKEQKVEPEEAKPTEKKLKTKK